jgi:chorismate mutase/GNAT superfamily N-acetyltransferase
MPTEVSLRRGGRYDLPAVAELYLAVRRDAVPHMPPGVHPDDDVRRWVASWDLATHDVWLAEADGTLVGFATLTATWLESLYVAPTAQRSGVGSALLEVAKAQRPDGFGLWVFESNVPARAFYAGHGLVELERTDGSANEERQPDVKMVWPGAEPVRYYRAMIDEVDLLIGDALARRAALTRVVQEQKRAESAYADADAAPDPARDAEREREIVARVAALVPELGEERVARIMHAVISESLDAARAES